MRTREWHESQALRDLAGGGVVLTLQVCLDRALESWILSFGPEARVVSPVSLAAKIAAQLEAARARYTRSPDLP